MENDFGFERDHKNETNVKSSPIRSAIIVFSIVVFAAIFIEQAGLFTAIKFVRERIEISVRAEAIEVTGYYVYRNPLPIPWSRGMSIPFFTDENQSAPATVTVTRLFDDAGKEPEIIETYWVGDNPYFSVTIPPFATATVRVEFTQRCTGGKGTYLLTTTQPWGEPLERGEYILTGQFVVNLKSNYTATEPDGVSFVRDNFMPEKDWTMTWEKEASL